MGEYADDAVESEFAREFEFEDESDHYDEPELPESSGWGRTPSYAQLPMKEVIRETDKAWLVTLKDGKTAWFPKSMCHMLPDSLHILCPRWLWGRKRIELGSSL